MKNQIKKSIKKRIHLETHFWSILDQFWEPKSTKNGSKTGSKTKAILRRRQTLVQPPLGKGAGSLEAPLGGSHFRARSSKRIKGQGDRAENDEGTKGKEQKNDERTKRKEQKEQKKDEMDHEEGHHSHYLTRLGPESWRIFVFFVFL